METTGKWTSLCWPFVILHENKTACPLIEQCCFQVLVYGLYNISTLLRHLNNLVKCFNLKQWTKEEIIQEQKEGRNQESDAAAE